ncbi:MAG: dihydroorotase [Oligoflexia bacterium]|nr:dihydroorotase [Oligoflexia bacterium]
MIVISGGTLIDPSAQREGEYDLLLEGATIKDVQKRGSFSELKSVRIIDARGKWVTPGFVDLHVHLREPGFEWKETIKSGAEAAVLGGYTSICCMPNTRPTNDCAEIAKFILDRGRNTGLARVLPIGSISKALQGKEMSPLSELKSAGCVAFSDDGEPIWDAGLMRRSLEWCLMLDLPISCHEEDKHLSCGGCMNESGLSTRLGLKGIPGVAEDVMIARDIELARFTGGRVHICHVSTARGTELIRRAKADGIRISAEATPHHIVLTEEAIGEYDTNCKMSPPLRGEADRLGVLAGLKDGTIDALASDHAPHERDSKEVEFAKASFGILGLQTSLPLLLDFVRQGAISRMRAIEALSTGPAKAFKLNAGRLVAGAPADITIIDPDYSWTFRKEVVRSLSLNSPFIGRQMRGIADTVVVEGRVVVDGQRLISQGA